MDGRLGGIKAVITGGAGAIGLATAKIFGREGATVFITDYNNLALSSALKLLKSEGIPASGINVLRSS